MEDGATYLNTGTWADLIFFPPSVLTAPKEQAIVELDAFLTDMEVGRLDRWIKQRPTYAWLSQDGDRTVDRRLCWYGRASDNPFDPGNIIDPADDMEKGAVNALLKSLEEPPVGTTGRWLIPMLLSELAASHPKVRLVVVDAMTYAANLRSLEPLIAERSIVLVKGDINDAALMRSLAALPVELVNFVALLPKNGGVQLLWETASEKNNRGFDVERSADGRSWTSLDFVSGHGTTALPHKYSFFDEHPLEGVNYYRLKQWDTDGRFEFTPIVIADVRANSQHFDVFPNPSADGNITFRLVSRQEGNGLLEIYDWAGYKVYKEALQLPEGTLAWPVDLATFPRGTYTSRLELADGTILFQKIVLH